MRCGCCSLRAKGQTFVSETSRQASRMRIAICDDDSTQIAVLESYVQTWAQKNDVEINIKKFNSAENFLFEWTATGQFDLLFLDIKMREMTGIELAEIIRKEDEEVAIVFVTGDESFVFKGYDVDALYYLIKPITEENCAKCLEKVASRLSDNEETSLLINAENKLKRIKYSDLICFESVSHYLEVHTTKEKLRYRKKIGDLEDELKDRPEFVRIHRCSIVNLKHVDSIESNSLFLDDGTELPISRNRWRDTHIAFVRYHADR